jgi:hypothetical protein
VSHGLQHASHALHPTVAVLHAMVLFSWRQLCGTTTCSWRCTHPGTGCLAGQLRTHWPVAVLQLYMTGVCAGAGGGVLRVMAVHLLLGQNPVHASVFYGESTCKTHRAGQSAGGSTCTTAARQLRPCANQHARTNSRHIPAGGGA